MVATVTAIFDICGASDSELANQCMGDAASEYTISDGQAQIRIHDKWIKSLAGQFSGPGVDRDDLIQIGRMALLRAMPLWQARCALWSYARPSVIREMMRFAAEERTGRGCSFDDIAATDKDVPDTCKVKETPETLLSLKERELIANEVVSQLSDLERIVLCMLFIEGFDQRTIATTLGISKSKVDRISHEAVENLRDLVGKRK